MNIMQTERRLGTHSFSHLPHSKAVPRQFIFYGFPMVIVSVTVKISYDLSLYHNCSRVWTSTFDYLLMCLNIDG